MSRGTILACLLLGVAGCTKGGGSSSGLVSPGSTSVAPSSSPAVVLQLGGGLAPAVRDRIEQLVRQVSSRPVTVVPPATSVGPLASGSLVLSFGDTATTRSLITRTEVASLPSEGFIVRSKDASGVFLLATDGQPLAPDPFSLGPNAGLGYGAYALLEEVGFAFLHPLAATLPQDLATPASPVDRRDSPRWPVRGIHLHTMHPLELTELLNGWGKSDPNDAASWTAMLPDWEKFLEWAVANRLNRVEWFLLSAASWQPFAEGPVRQARQAQLVARSHAWGIAAGADMPVAEKQQHAWFMVENPGTLAQEKAQIDARVAWCDQAGFDFFSTELGTSEFTSTDDQRMVAWLDELAAVSSATGKRAYVKAHCSTGQVAKSYVDPLNGGPLNYNFLSRVCDPGLGVYPHTVEVYGLDDPAPTYGNTDFGYMRTFMEEEAGRREVIWHPETAYWISYDVNVPLFLPLYAERRLHDLRLIAHDEDQGLVGRGAHAGSRIQGQIVFSSGWEWGYWLNDVVAARAAWQPYENEPTDDAAFAKLLADVLAPLGPGVAAAIADTCRVEHDLLVLGVVNGASPTSIIQRNGIGYLEGWDTWDDVAVSLSRVPVFPMTPTQPTKLGLVDMRYGWFWGGPDYATQVEPLLAAMESAFATEAVTFDGLRAGVPASARPLVDDMADAAQVTALRAKQVHGLYDYVQGTITGAANARARLTDARSALDTAQVLVQGRERSYRVEPDRVAAWRKNPTAYAYTYLWTAHSLYFWWRDEEKAVDAPWSPFVMNIIDPVDVVIGESPFIPFLQAARAWGDQHGMSALVDGLAEPSAEPSYPQGGLRQRP